jgi:hypothetical protein
MIAFSRQDKNAASFKYRRWPEYLAAWILGVPITVGFSGFVISSVLSDVNSPFQSNPFIYLWLILSFPIVMFATNAIHFPLMNPHWIFTEVRTLIIKADADPILKLGLFPFSIQRSIPREEIERIQLTRHKYGKGLGFFYFWMTQGHLHSLCVLTKDNKRYYLAINESKDGRLSDAGKELCAFLEVPFEETY